MAPIKCRYLVFPECFASDENRRINESDRLITESGLKLCCLQKEPTVQRPQCVGPRGHILTKRQPHIYRCGPANPVVQFNEDGHSKNELLVRTSEKLGAGFVIWIFLIERRVDDARV